MIRKIKLTGSGNMNHDYNNPDLNMAHYKMMKYLVRNKGLSVNRANIITQYMFNLTNNIACNSRISDKNFLFKIFTYIDRILNQRLGIEDEITL